MTWFQNLNLFKKLALLILLILSIGILCGYAAPFYVGTLIYGKLKLISIIILYVTVFWSLVNTGLLMNRYKRKLSKQSLWIFISILPFLYISFLIFTGNL
ncbi:hypothetical protein [uncultured Nonlabens sp.]|uniref:hypothetical protein n=1 Tax=uncultured Nonlabens sp. TaxID=859306 RepID=UPI00261908FF|nr:hypothetical protein [uncultured Nonlabens sp.]